MREPLAHSPRGTVPPQTYHEHVSEVVRRAVANARQAGSYYSGERNNIVECVEAAALQHDLGKLDAANQDVLQRESRDPLPVPHEDAGVAALLRLHHNESAVLVCGHHAGLFSNEEERRKKSRILRNVRVPEQLGVSVAEYVDHQLDTYLAIHRSVGFRDLSTSENRALHRCGFTRRLALSCLVDGDHGDTARHYNREVPIPYIEPLWSERLAALERYVEDLPQGEMEAERQRNQLRQRVFDACRDAAIDPPLRACDAPVGSGKTTAIMAHLLRVAHEKRLRHIFVVLPYVNIIKQSVEIFRDALVLPGERAEEIVAEHHHQADFQDLDLRQLATLWKAPIIVTTAVQYFETLGSPRPSRLRKLHELPGSAVFVDETHAAIPSHLWPQVWQWLEIWTRDWGGHLVLASGSLPRFWELPEFVDPTKTAHEVPDLVPEGLRRELEDAEQKRVIPKRRRQPLDCDGLIEWVVNERGPRLLILNTVQSGAVVADRMQKAGREVLHLSTALAPVHRDPIVERVKERLRSRWSDWTLVATSCVEAGMNFSFRRGFRESARTASLIQTTGRVSRGAEYTDAIVWDFRVLDDSLSQHPGFTVPRRVLDALFDAGDIVRLKPSVLAREAMRRELTHKDETRAQKLRQAETDMEYRAVGDLCRVIEADTRTVIIDLGIAEALRRGEKVAHRELLRYSVQMWTYKIEKLAVEPLFPNARDDDLLYVWTGDYDPDFLGYMAGVLPLLDGLKEGVFIA